MLLDTPRPISWLELASAKCVEIECSDCTPISSRNIKSWHRFLINLSSGTGSAGGSSLELSYSNPKGSVGNRALPCWLWNFGFSNPEDEAELRLVISLSHTIFQRLCRALAPTWSLFQQGNRGHLVWFSWGVFVPPSPTSGFPPGQTLNIKFATIFPAFLLFSVAFILPLVLAQTGNRSCYCATDIAPDP